MEKIKKNMVYACFAGAVLLAAALFSGCDTPVSGKGGIGNSGSEVTVKDAEGLQSAFTSSTVKTINIARSFDSNVSAIVKTDKTVKIPKNYHVKIAALQANANITIAPGSSAGVKAAVSQAETGILEIKKTFIVSSTKTFTVKTETALVFSATVTKSTTKIDGSLIVEAQNGVSHSGGGALTLDGSGTVKIAGETKTSKTIETGSITGAQELPSSTTTKPETVDVNSSGTTGGSTTTGGGGGTGVAAAPPVPTYTISGNLSAVSTNIGGRSFSFTDLGDTVISLKELVPVEDASVDGGIRYTTPGDNVGTATADGSTYTISGVPAGTYRLTAEDPTGLYDFVAPEVVVPDADLTQDINLTVFQGLKLTVRIPRNYVDDADHESGQAKYNGNFILPVRDGAFRGSETISVDLNVDWGDGAVSTLTTKPGGLADPAYTHVYTESLGSSDKKDFVIRLTGTCVSDGVNTETPGKFGMGYNPQIPGIPSSAGGQYSTYQGYPRHGHKSKIVRAAGNITALTTGSTVKNKAYAGAFWECKNLEDISGLTFTDEGDQGTYFLMNTFAKCTSLKKISANLLPPNIDTTKSSFLYATFQGTAIEVIPDGFLPSYTQAGVEFLYGAFGGVSDGDGAAIKDIPAGFIPASLTTVGNYFLQHTFQDCKNLESIPSNFASHITSVGTNFLYYTFAKCTNLTTVPANFVPTNLTGSIGTYFLRGTFLSSGITAIPVDLIPASLNGINVGNYFLVSAFSGCKSLTTVNLDFIKNVTVNGTYFLEGMLRACTSLTDVYIPYIDTKNKASPFNLLLRDNNTQHFNLYITGGNASNVLQVNASAGILATGYDVTVYLDNAELVTAYKDSSNWSNVDDNQFRVREN